MTDVNPDATPDDNPGGPRSPNGQSHASSWREGGGPGAAAVRPTREVGVDDGPDGTGDRSATTQLPPD